MAATQRDPTGTRPVCAPLPFGAVQAVVAGSTLTIAVLAVGAAVAIVVCPVCAVLRCGLAGHACLWHSVNTSLNLTETGTDPAGQRAHIVDEAIAVVVPAVARLRRATERASEAEAQ